MTITHSSAPPGIAGDSNRVNLRPDGADFALSGLAQFPERIQCPPEIIGISLRRVQPHSPWITLAGLETMHLLPASDTPARLFQGQAQ